MKIIEDVKKRRILLGLTQRDVAARAGMMRQAYQRIEAGQSPPTLITLERICDALGCELGLEEKK